MLDSEVAQAFNLEKKIAKYLENWALHLHVAQFVVFLRTSFGSTRIVKQ